MMAIIVLVLRSLYFVPLYFVRGVDTSNQAQSTKYQALDLYPQDLPDDQHTRDLHEQSQRDQIVAAWILPQHAHVIGIQESDC